MCAHTQKVYIFDFIKSPIGCFVEVICLYIIKMIC